MKRNILLIVLLLTTLLLSLLAISVTAPSANYLSQKAEAIVRLCKDSNRTDFCYTDAFTEFSKGNDITSSITLLRRIQERDSKTNNCHFIAHVIAFEELKKYPQNWEGIFTEVPVDACTGGYLMGILEGYQFKNKTALSDQTIPEICSRISKKIATPVQTLPENSCDHIMGHLILAQEGSIDNSLDVCSSLKSSSQKECFAGVFMESEVQRNIALHNKIEPLRWTLDAADNQESVCRKHEDIIAEMCWRELSHMLVFLKESYPPAAYEACQKAPSETSRNECYIHGVGIMTVSSRFDPDHLSLLCQPYAHNTVLLDSCISMTVGTLLGSSSSLADTAAVFCATIPQQNKQYCYNRLGIGLAGSENEKTRTAMCSKIPREYQRICLQS